MIDGSRSHRNRAWRLSPDQWRSIARRVWEQRSDDDIAVRASAVAFSAMFAIPMLMIALVSLYGIVASPRDVVAVVQRLDSVLPESASDILTSQLQSIAGQNTGALSLGALTGFAAAVWSVSGGVNRLKETMNEVYGTNDDRPWYVKRAIAAAAALGLIGAIGFAVFLIGLLPATLGSLGIGGAGRVAVLTGRWFILGVLMLGLLGALYRLAPQDRSRSTPWFPLGSFIAALAWLAMSFGFGLFVQNFGSYNETYGSLGSVIAFMAWLYLSAYIVLMAGELNSEIERAQGMSPRPPG